MILNVILISINAFVYVYLQIYTHSYLNNMMCPLYIKLSISVA